MRSFCLIVIICLSILSCFGDKLDWNELKFTQEWGYSACRQFKDRGSSERKCRFEDKPSIWSVHGIWPTKEGSEGPNFCKKVKFDITALNPIIHDLNEFWYEIDETKQADHFWEHEWLKHGSCAMELDIFGTELKYFGEGLNLRSKLDLYSILKTGGGIIPAPTQGYNLADIHAAFQKALGSETSVPYVQCLRTKSNETNDWEYHMLAIEMCLDKDLKILDCRSKPHNLENVKEMYGDQAEPCPADKTILYTDYNLKRGPAFKSYHRMKPYFAKNFPMKNSIWKKYQKHRRQ